MNRRLGHAAKTHTRNHHRRNRRIRGTEGPHRLPDCRDPKHVGRWPQRTSRHDRNRKASKKAERRRQKKDGPGAACQICQAQARLQANASCGRKTKEAENERRWSAGDFTSSEEAMGCDQSGQESGVAALAKKAEGGNASSSHYYAMTLSLAAGLIEKAIRRGTPGPTQHGVHCFAPFVRGYRLTHHGVTTKLSHNLWR